MRTPTTDSHRPAQRRPGCSGWRYPARTIPLAILLLLGGPGPSAAQPLTETVEHAIEIAADTMVSVMNFAGHVEVHGTDPGEDRTLRIIGVKRLETELPPREAARIFKRVNLDLRRRGRHIQVGPNRLRRGATDRQDARAGESEVPITDIRPPRRIPPVSVDLELWLPEGASLEVRTFSAPITVREVAAPEGAFLLRSISGNLTVSGLEGRDLRAETVSGDLSLTNVASHRGFFKTLTAAIRMSGDFHPEGWYQVQTHSGPVVLGLGSLPGFAVEARTYSGEIRNELSRPAEVAPRSLETRRGAGKPHISISTFSGLIHLAGETAPREDRGTGR